MCICKSIATAEFSGQLLMKYCRDNAQFKDCPQMWPACHPPQIVACKLWGRSESMNMECL